MLGSSKEKLKPQCIETGDSYGDKVAARKEEIESLQEALRRCVQRSGGAPRRIRFPQPQRVPVPPGVPGPAEVVPLFSSLTVVSSLVISSRFPGAPTPQDRPCGWSRKGLRDPPLYGTTLRLWESSHPRSAGKPFDAPTQCSTSSQGRLTGVGK